MKTSTRVALITLVVAVPAFFLGNVIWPPSPELSPTSGQIPFFIILSILESLALGLGVAFIMLCWDRAKEERLAFLAIAWLLVSWWVHDNMHKANGLDINGLLIIEYLFHVTLIAAGVILARFFWKKYGSGYGSGSGPVPSM